MKRMDTVKENPLKISKVLSSEGLSAIDAESPSHSVSSYESPSLKQKQNLKLDWNQSNTKSV